MGGILPIFASLFLRLSSLQILLQTAALESPQLVSVIGNLYYSPLRQEGIGTIANITLSETDGLNTIPSIMIPVEW